MRYLEVLEKLKQGWILEKYRGLYGLPPKWQLCMPNVPREWALGGHNKDIYGVVYHQTAEKLIKLTNVKLVRKNPIETYKWVEDTKP